MRLCITEGNLIRRFSYIIPFEIKGFNLVHILSTHLKNKSKYSCIGNIQSFKFELAIKELSS